MIEHLKAIRDFLATLAYTTHLVWADQVTGQYVVLGGRGWDRPEEMPACGQDQSLQTAFTVKAVTGTPEGVGIMLDRIRSQLSPNLAVVSVPMTGRDLRVWFERSEFIDVDQDAVTTGTNRHPAFGVDTYRLASEPI